MGGFGGAGLIPELFRGILEGGWGSPEGFGGVLGGGGGLGAPRGLLEASWGGNWVHRVVPRAIGGHWGGAGNHSVVPWCIRWGYRGGGGALCHLTMGQNAIISPLPCPPSPSGTGPPEAEDAAGYEDPHQPEPAEPEPGAGGPRGQAWLRGGCRGSPPPPGTGTVSVLTGARLDQWERGWVGLKGEGRSAWPMGVRA